MIKNIIFDLGGVILRLNDVSEPVRRFEELGVRDASELLGVYGQKGIFLELEKGEIGAQEFLDRLSKLTGRPVSYAEAEYAWMGYLKDVPMERLENLRKLRESYKLFLLSNLNPFFGGWVKSKHFSGDGHSICDYMDNDYYSYELHDYKPAPSIYQKVLDAENLIAEECIFVDDSPRNVEGAASLGMRTLLVPKDADWMPMLNDILESEK